MEQQNIQNLQRFLKVLNQQPFVNLTDNNQDFKFKTDITNVEHVYRGLEFVFVSIWKIYLIVCNSNLSQDDQVRYLQMLPDPSGNQFITEQNALQLMGMSVKLQEFFSLDLSRYAQAFQLGGGTDKSKKRSKTDLVVGLIFTPLKILEDQFGPIIAIPLELITGFLSALGTFAQILSSTFGMFPPIPGAATVFEALAELTELVHLITSSFNMFLNITRGNWYIVIQTIIGMFPQIMELINGITMQLVVINRFVKMSNNMVGYAFYPAKTIIKMLTPVLLKPLSYLKDGSPPYTT